MAYKILQKIKEDEIREYGVAINQCYEDEEGRLWVTNDEYSNQVNFCPFTGKAAKIKLKTIPEYKG